MTPPRLHHSVLAQLLFLDGKGKGFVSLRFFVFFFPLTFSWRFSLPVFPPASHRSLFPHNCFKDVSLSLNKSPFPSLRDVSLATFFFLLFPSPFSWSELFPSSAVEPLPFLELFLFVFAIHFHVQQDTPSERFPPMFERSFLRALLRLSFSAGSFLPPTPPFLMINQVRSPDW